MPGGGDPAEAPHAPLAASDAPVTISISRREIDNLLSQKWGDSFSSLLIREFLVPKSTRCQRIDPGLWTDIAPVSPCARVRPSIRERSDGLRPHTPAKSVRLCLEIGTAYWPFAMDRSDGNYALCCRSQHYCCNFLKRRYGNERSTRVGRKCSQAASPKDKNERSDRLTDGLSGSDSGAEGFTKLKSSVLIRLATIT